MTTKGNSNMDDISMLEYSDKDFALEAKRIHDNMIYHGWKLIKRDYAQGVLYIFYEKNGYATSVEFGCKGDVDGD